MSHRHANENTSRLAASHAEVDIFHPGPGATAPTARPPVDPAERLATLERELLELSIERVSQGVGRRADLARTIIAMRAVLGCERRDG